MKKDNWSFESKWLIFYWGWTFDLSYETCGYFDARHRINLDLIFFSLTIILPIYSKHTDECQSPKWGISYHNNTFWIYRGGKGNMNGGTKWWTINMPWQYDWVRTSALRKDGTWEHETKRDEKNFYEDKWKDILWIEAHPYTCVLKSGEIQEVLATIKVEEREWRQLWLKWTSFNNRVRKTIDVDFNDEVGEKRGTWKGGCTGCNYLMKHGELPIQTLRRMEKERKF